MKTAMQELIEWYQREHFVKTTFYIQLLNKFESLVEKEKEQIIDAHTNAYLIGEDDISVEDANEASIKYYNQNYNQNK
jgi:hypothetical protein